MSFLFLQNLKDQILTTNVWLEHVSKKFENARVKAVQERLGVVKENASFEIAAKFSFTVQASEKARHFQSLHLFSLP